MPARRAAGVAPPVVPALTVHAGAAATRDAIPARVSASIAVRCAFLSYRVPSDWYLPAGDPLALLWLQHGFTESKSSWSDFGRRAAAEGFLAVATSLPSADLLGCTVQNLGTNTRFLNNIAFVFGTAADPRGPLAASHAAALAAAGLPARPLPGRQLLAGHSVGGEAVLQVARRLVERYPAAGLAGVLLADPVASLVRDTTAASLAVMSATDLPVYCIAAPPSSCNAHQRGTTAVVRGLPSREFHGVTLDRGSHGDLLGPAFGPPASVMCGAPTPRNTDAAQTLALGWLADAAAGTRTAAWYPGGAAYQRLLDAGVISTLPLRRHDEGPVTGRR